MKSTVTTVTILLLLFNGIGAFYGGFQFITDPSGSKLQMSLSFLEHSPFSNYLIPGIILIVVNGIFSLVTIAWILLKRKNYPWLIIIQSVLLSGWLIIEIIMLRVFYAPMHVTLLMVGASLFVCGLYLNKHQQI